MTPKEKIDSLIAELKMLKSIAESHGMKHAPDFLAANITEIYRRNLSSKEKSNLRDAFEKAMKELDTIETDIKNMKPGEKI